jgi:lipase chaperone LimK
MVMGFVIMRTLAKALIPLLLIVAAAALWLLAGTDSSQPLDAPPQAANATAEPLDIAPPTRTTEPPSHMVNSGKKAPLPESLPPSLAGTSVPAGWAKVDSTGALIPTPELRQMFEYYLSALGEESLQQLVTRIENSLAVLEEPARSQALETLGAYLDYKLAVSDLEDAYGGAGQLSPAQVQQRMEEIHALRRTWLDNPTAEAFFAQDEAIDRFQVEQVRIARNTSLTDEQRQAAIARAELALPAPIREAREQTRRFTEYEQARKQYADDPAALKAWRQDAFGAEAAERLAELDQKQSAWDKRWKAYSDEREALLSSGLAGPELDTALDRLRARHFSENEQVRAKALDSIR